MKHENLLILCESIAEHDQILADALTEAFLGLFGDKKEKNKEKLAKILNSMDQTIVSKLKANPLAYGNMNPEMIKKNPGYLKVALDSSTDSAFAKSIISLTTKNTPLGIATSNAVTILSELLSNFNNELYHSNKMSADQENYKKKSHGYLDDQKLAGNTRLDYNY